MSYGGGVQHWIVRIIPHLIKKGYNIMVVDSTCGIKNEFNFPQLCSKFYYITLPYLHYFKEQKIIRDIILETDIIYYDVALAYYDILISRIMRTEKVPIIGGWRAPIYFENILHNLYVNLLKKRLLKNLSAHHVTNESYKNLLNKWGFSNVFLIPHGIDINMFKPDKRKYESEKFRILFIARLTYQKGVDIFVKIIKKFLSMNPNADIEVWVAGEGPHSSLLDEILADRRVKYFGYVRDTDKLYGKSHVFLLTSRQEPFGITLLEALSSENIAIATPTEGPMFIKKYIEDELLIAYYVEEFLRILQELYELFRKDRKEFKKKCGLSRIKVKKHFSLDIHVERLDMMFKEVYSNEK